MVATTAEVKKALVAAGFELYRTRGQLVCLADRVRDNLIMDSGVSVACQDLGLAVRVVVRAQRSDFPSDAVSALFERARALGTWAVNRGFREVETVTTPRLDPADRSRTLDTWYEVVFEKPVAAIPEALAEVRLAVGSEKTVKPSSSAR